MSLHWLHRGDQDMNEMLTDVSEHRVRVLSMNFARSTITASCCD